MAIPFIDTTNPSKAYAKNTKVFSSGFERENGWEKIKNRSAVSQ